MMADFFVIGVAIDVLVITHFSVFVTTGTSAHRLRDIVLLAMQMSLTGASMIQTASKNGVQQHRGDGKKFTRGSHATDS
ncbi:hypothetical protein [Planctomycetes bacterium K23_9]